MTLGYPLLCTVGIVLAGCAAVPQPPTQGALPGYRFNDAIHPNSVVSPSPQALHNASRGVWLWPPKETTRSG
jgi:hypothetical protein